MSLALICETTEGKGALDFACTSPVAGKNWIQEFIKGLSEEDKKNIVEEKSTKSLNLEVVKSDHLLNVLLVQLK